MVMRKEMGHTHNQGFDNVPADKLSRLKVGMYPAYSMRKCVLRKKKKKIAFSYIPLS